MTSSEGAGLRPVLLGGYAAKSCARKTHNEYDRTLTRPPQPPTPPDLQRLFDLGNAHELAVFATWIALDVDVVDLSATDLGKAAHIAATIEAMNVGHAVILGGWLPDDLIGGRTGKPDVLLRSQDGVGYYPADVKAHFVLDSKGAGGLVSSLSQPLTMTLSESHQLRHREEDLLQLAHYRRMLEACGRATSDELGAIIGNDPEPYLAWYDLTEPRFRTFSRSQGATKRSALERYDHEQAFRVAVAHVAQQRVGTPDDPAALVSPIGQEECLRCVWAPVCVDTLPAGDLSRELRGTLAVREYLALRAQGIETLDQLADADLEELLDSPYAEETADQVRRRRRLYQAHMSAQLARDGVVLRLKPDAGFDVPQARVEIDLDMECTRSNLVYLWGVLVTRDGASSYHPFADPDVGDADSELELARRCFDWIRDTHPDATVYHYAHVEKSHARRILGDGGNEYDGTSADVGSWVDLLPPTRACLDSRAGLGLKVVATEGAGVHWRDDDPGGLNSQEWLDQARAGDAGAWQRILDYNEDDVRATLAVRRFLRSAMEPAPDPYRESTAGPHQIRRP